MTIDVSLKPIEGFFKKELAFSRSKLKAIADGEYRENLDEREAQMDELGIRVDDEELDEIDRETTLHETNETLKYIQILEERVRQLETADYEPIVADFKARLAYELQSIKRMNMLRQHKHGKLESITGIPKTVLRWLSRIAPAQESDGRFLERTALIIRLEKFISLLQEAAK